MQHITHNLFRYLFVLSAVLFGVLTAHAKKDTISLSSYKSVTPSGCTNNVSLTQEGSDSILTVSFKTGKAWQKLGVEFPITDLFVDSIDFAYKGDGSDIALMAYFKDQHNVRWYRPDDYNLSKTTWTQIQHYKPTLPLWDDEEVTELGSEPIKKIGFFVNPGYATEGSFSIKNIILYYTPQATVTTHPIANALTYSGSAQELVTKGEAKNGTLSYSLNNKDFSTSIPTGTKADTTYTIYYKAVGNTGYRDSQVYDPIKVTISKAKLTITARDTITYGDDAPNPYTLRYDAFKGNDNPSVLKGTTPTCYCAYAKGNFAGSYSITVTGSMTADNYDVTIQDGTLTVNKAASSVTSKPTAKTLTYSGTAQTLINAGEASGGAMWYSLNGSSYSDQLPQETKAGTYTVYYMVKGDNNHTDLTPASNTLEVTINKAVLTVTADNKTVTYGDPAPDYTVSYSGFVNKETKSVITEPTCECTYTSSSSVGSYDIIPKGAAADNYTFTYIKGTLTVNKAPLTVTADDKTITYGDPAPTYTASYEGWRNSDDPSKLSGELAFACAYGEDNAAGTYPIYPSGVSSGNYDITFKSGTLTVQKVAPTLIDAPAARTNLTYNGSAQELVEAGSATGGTIKFTMDTTDTQSWKTYIPTATNAGKYTIFYKLFGDKNHYDLAIDSVKAEIDKAVAKLSSHPKAKTPTYTGKPQVLIEAGVADGGTLLYRLKDGEFAQALPQGTLAGSYTVHYKVVGDNNHYDFTPAPDSLVARVNKASLAIRGDNKAIKYGDPEPAEYTASCTGWVNGEDKSVLRGTLTVTCGYHQWNNAGSYAIVPGGVTADNYAITFKNGTLTVKKAPLTITADDQTVTYGDPAPEYTASYSGWKGQDGPSVLGSSLLFICAYGAGNDAGTYDIQPHGAEATNYTFTYVNGTLTVDKATPEVTPPTAIEGLKYIGAAQTLITAGYTTGGTLEYALDEQDYSPVLPTATAVGTYTVYYRVNGGTNYNDVGSDSLMVTIAEPDEPTALAPVQAPVSHVQKIIRHDQLIIIRDDNTYTIHGQRID